MFKSMIRTGLLAALVLGLAAPVFAEGKGNGQDKKHGKPAVQMHVANPATGACPPGLAKKNPPCIPPGQAKKHYHYDVGDRLEGDYILIRDPYRYGLPDGTYYRLGDYVYQVDSNTLRILAITGLVSALLN